VSLVAELAKARCPSRGIADENSFASAGACNSLLCLSRRPILVNSPGLHRTVTLAFSQEPDHARLFPGT
jgi:hypothetical protein